MTNLALAIFMAALAYGLLSFGNVLMKKGATELPAIEQTSAKNNVKNFLKNPKWLIGYMIGNFQIVFLWIALANAPMSLVTPMAGFGLIVLVLCSVYYLGEKISRPMYFGIFITTIGIISNGFTATGTEPTFNWEENLEIARSPIALILLILLLVGAIIAIVICISLKYKYADVLFGIAGGLAQSFGVIFSKFMMAGFSDGDSLQVNLGRWPFYLFLILLVIGNFSAMVCQQYGYQKGKAIIVTPLVNVISIIIPAMIGVILFAEWANYSETIVLWKVIALILLSFGVIILSYFNTKDLQEELIKKNK